MLTACDLAQRGRQRAQAYHFNPRTLTACDYKSDILRYTKLHFNLRTLTACDSKMKQKSY